MGSLSIWHWLIVAIVAGILFFGWKQMPDMARSLGRSMRIFKTEIKGMSEDDKARDEAKNAVAEAPPALEPRRADVVKKTEIVTTEAPPAAARPPPRPSPSPRAGTRTPGAN